MKVIITYTARKEVEVEIDNRFAELLDPNHGYMADMAMARELRAKAEQKIQDKDLVEVTEVITANREDILWEW